VETAQTVLLEVREVLVRELAVMVLQAQTLVVLETLRVAAQVAQAQQVPVVWVQMGVLD